MLGELKRREARAAAEENEGKAWLLRRGLADWEGHCLGGRALVRGMIASPDLPAPLHLQTSSSITGSHLAV